MGTVSLLIDTPWSEPEWFPKRDGDKDYEMSVGQVKELRRAPVLLRFATNDKFVSKEAAAALARAAANPKTVKYYDAEHALNAGATRDRQAWLQRELGLKSAK